MARTKVWSEQSQAWIYADRVVAKDGTSVTIESIEESTVAGGSTRITFSDGNTILVKNGASAYQYAVQAGFTGTEQEFAERLNTKSKITKSDLESSVQSSLNKADSALQPNDLADWVKAEEKPMYTADEVGALPDSTEIPSELSDLNEDANHRLVTDTEKATWNAKSNFSGSYNDLTNKPTIPSIAGLASTTYVDEAVKNKVDKDGNKVLSTNDYTTAEKNKLANIAAGAEVNVNADWDATSGDAQILNKPTLGSMAAKNSVAKSDLASGVQTSLGKADSALQPGDISDWAKTATKPSYTKSEVGLGNVDNTSDVNKPVSTAQASAIAEAKKAGTDAQSNLTTHTNNKTNPHSVTKAQVGLGNVDNVKQYSASNPPPYPVTSVNGKTGEVNVDFAVASSSEPDNKDLLWIDLSDNSNGEGNVVGNNNLLKGRTIAVLGDSISTTEFTTPNYWQLISEKTGCNFLNYSVSGSRIAVSSSATTESFVERARKISTDADAILIMGGTNDANKGILLGTWDSTDNTTFYGALNELISSIRIKYSGKPIIFCTPIKTKTDTGATFPYTLSDLKTAAEDLDMEVNHCASAIKAKCIANGITLVDLHEGSGIGSGRPEYFRDNDSLHPSLLGEYRIANMIYPVLEQQFLFMESKSEEEQEYNLMKTSIDTDFSIYQNGAGYLDEHRLNSNGEVVEIGTSSVTGFIEYNTKDILRVKGLTMLSGATYNGTWYEPYIIFYDDNFSYLGGCNLDSFKGICSQGLNKWCISSANNIYAFDFSTLTDSRIKYIRISGPYGSNGTGAKMIVTAGREIE